MSQKTFGFYSDFLSFFDCPRGHVRWDDSLSFQIHATFTLTCPCAFLLLTC